MDKISEQINFTNNKIHSYDKTRKIIVNLGSKKCDNSDNYSHKISHIQNSLLMSIFETNDKDLYDTGGKENTRKVRKYSVK